MFLNEPSQLSPIFQSDRQHNTRLPLSTTEQPFVSALLAGSQIIDVKQKPSLPKTWTDFLAGAWTSQKMEKNYKELMQSRVWNNLQNKWLALVKDCSCPSQSVKMFYSKKINYFHIICGNLILLSGVLQLQTTSFKIS